MNTRLKTLLVLLLVIALAFAAGMFTGYNGSAPNPMAGNTELYTSFADWWNSNQQHIKQVAAIAYANGYDLGYAMGVARAAKK